MPIIFKPIYTISLKIAQCLIRIEAAKEKIAHLPLTPSILSSLRESARLYSTHYSTFIEGNRLTNEQIQEIVQFKGHFPGREREEHEVKGYYAALTYIEQLAAQKIILSQVIIQKIHALVMSNGKINAASTPYRDGQNVIYDGHTKTIVYMPPEAKDVTPLMQSMINWTNNTIDLPCPIKAAIIHYQCATIHPYYDGNGRTSRLLTTLVLHLGGYDLKGIYALEEYYARNLNAYYEALSVGPSHNYYMGRAESDITLWIEYFTEGMAIACEKIINHMQTQEHTSIDRSPFLRMLNPKQRKVLELFISHATITSAQVGQLFGFQPRTSSKLCKLWVNEGFFEVVNSAKKNRTYKLAARYEKTYAN